MAELKTKPNRKSVARFIASIEDARRREDAGDVLALMQELTGEQPLMWGERIIGFGTYHYRYKSGREGDWPVTGFAPRKNGLTIYVMSGFSKYEKHLGKLGRHKTGKGCLYVNRLEDLDIKVLRRLLRDSVRDMRKR